MSHFSQLLGGLGATFQPLHLMLLVIGVIVGVIAGALPGISFVNAMAMSLPFTYFITPIASMMFLAGIYIGGAFGGSLCSILLNIPGDPDALPACWDGYPLSKKKGPLRALSISITAGFVGGMTSALILAFGAPPFAKFALRFDQPEFFAATFLGLVSVLALSKANLIVSFMSLFIGLAIGAVGSDPLYGVNRLTFDLRMFESGIDFVVVMIGLYAIGEVIATIAARSVDFQVKEKAAMKMLGLRDLWALRAPLLRGTFIGSVIGIVPGAGATVGALVAYGIEKQANPRGNEFGTGIEAGLAAPESSKSATTGTAMIPMLTLGIPGSSASAIMLAALMLKGVQPGPLLFNKDPALIYAIFAAFLIGNLLMVAVSIVVAKFFGRLMSADPAIIGSFIVVFSLVGAYAIRNNMADVYLCIGFGVAGYLCQRLNFPTAPLVLGVILGPLAERYFMTSMANYDDNLLIFVQRPISCTLMIGAVIFMVWALFPGLTEKASAGIRRLVGRGGGNGAKPTQAV